MIHERKHGGRPKRKARGEGQPPKRLDERRMNRLVTNIHNITQIVTVRRLRGLANGLSPPGRTHW